MSRPATASVQRVGPPEPATDAVLRLRGFGVAFRERVILSAIDLDVAARGAVVIMGPAGTGKSTLLRTLAGFNDANPSLRTWGGAEYLGEQLGRRELPALVAQSARLMVASAFENIVSALPERGQLTQHDQRALARRLAERAGIPEVANLLDEPVVRLPLALQRRLAIVRAVAAGPRLLCVDEPTAGLSQSDSDGLLGYLREVAEERALLVVLHSQEQARLVRGDVVLLAGGVVQERQPAARMFDAPRTAAGRDFARTGTCAVPAPGAASEELADDAPLPAPVPEAARRYVSDSFGPRGFLWLEKGVLAGTPMPGVFFDVDYDLQALRRVGVTVLVTLTEAPLDPAPLARFGMRSLWQPIPDMGATALDEAELLCRRIEALIAAGEVVAVHCRAGLGRTGTVLAAHLVWTGKSALAALEAVRRVEARWVQSEAQVAFLEAFAQRVAGAGADAPRRAPPADKFSAPAG